MLLMSNQYSGISKQVISIIISVELFVCLQIARGTWRNSQVVNWIDRLNVVPGEQVLQQLLVVAIEDDQPAALILFLDVTFAILYQLLHLLVRLALANEIVHDVVVVVVMVVKFVEQN